MKTSLSDIRGYSVVLPTSGPEIDLLVLCLVGTTVEEG